MPAGELKTHMNALGKGMANRNGIFVFFFFSTLKIGKFFKC